MKKILVPLLAAASLALTPFPLCNPTTNQTAIWQMNGNQFVSGGYGPTIPHGWY